jgi:hypothetical protein
MSAVEEAIEVVEDVVEAVPTEWIGEFTRRELLGQYAFIGGCVAVIAGSAGYFLAKKQLQTKYESIVESEVNKTRDYYKSILKQTAPKASGSSTVSKEKRELAERERAAVEEIVQQYRPSEGGEDDEPKPEPEETVVVESSVNVFLQDQADDSWDLEEELKSRSPDEPYVISFDEFMENEDEFSQTTWTYYAGDDVLANEKDQEVTYPDPVVGEQNLRRFGHGSGDPRVVHVRNERLSSDFEILLSDGKYAHEVAGLQHSDGGSRGRQQDSQLRRFRGDRE